MAAPRSSMEKMAMEASYKENVETAETSRAALLLGEEDAAFLASFSEAKRKRLLRKCDWHLVPMLLFLYLITYIDKVNIGNAKIEGLLPSLHMDGYQYNVALSIFFIPYILAEVPSNMIMEHLPRPSWYLGGCVFAWVSTSQLPAHIFITC